MDFLKTFAPVLLSYLASNGYNRAIDWGNKLAEQPLVVKKDNPYSTISSDGITQKLMGTDDGDWTRREQRRFRKSMGMSKLDFRNWKALKMGLDPSLNYSRRDIRAAERSYSFYHPENLAAQEVPGILKTPSEMYLEYVQTNFGLKPLPYMQLPEKSTEVVSETPITYNFGNSMNNYWATLALKVLGNLTQDELFKISGNDGEINYDDAVAWQKSIGTVGDGKLGENTVSAMNNKYGLNVVSDKNPGRKLISSNYSNMRPYLELTLNARLLFFNTHGFYPD